MLFFPLSRSPSSTPIPILSQTNHRWTSTVKPEESSPALPRQRCIWEAFPRGAAVKHLPADAGDASSTPGLGRSPPWRRKWQPIPAFLPEESDGRRSLEDYSPWSGKSWTWLSDRACKHMPTPSGAVLPKPLATRLQHTPKGSILPRGREGPSTLPAPSIHPPWAGEQEAWCKVL